MTRARCSHSGPHHAAAVPAQQPEAAPDGYAELFAETERVAEREREQPALFEAQPTTVDVAAAQPLHLDDSAGDAPGGRASDTTAERTQDESAAENAALTVSEAARQAEIIAEMRAELDARAGAATPAAPARARSTRTTKTSTSGRPATTTSTRAPMSGKARACPPGPRHCRCPARSGALRRRSDRHDLQPRQCAEPMPARPDVVGDPATVPGCPRSR